MGMREVVLAALVGALIVIAAVAVPALALESPGFHAVVYPVALALFVPYAWLTLPAVLKEGHEMTALYALFVSMAIATVWAIGELSGRSIGRMRLIVLEGALVSVMALSFASVLISLGVTNTLILSSPLAVAAMIYIVAALVGIVPPEGVEAGISDNAATASIPSNIEVETIISRDEEKEQTQTPPSVEIHENLPTICIENTEEETPSIPAIVVPEEAGEEPVPAINCEAEAPAATEEAAITEEPLSIAEEEAPAPVVIEEEPISAEPAIIAEEEAIPAEAVAIIEEEAIPAESAPAEEIVIEEPVEEVLIEEEPAIIEPEVIAEAVIEEPSPAEEIAEPVIAEEEEIIPVEENEPVLVEDVEPAITEEPAPIAAIEEDVIQIPRPPAITVSSRLSVPTAPTLTNTAKLEEPRVPSAPSLSNKAELVEGTPRNMVAQQHADDFWASFYVQGVDELQLQDGVYYMTLVINDNEVGTITTVLSSGVPSVNTAELRSYLVGSITDEAEDRIFLDRGEYISIDDLRASGLQASFDSNAYTISMTFSTVDMPIQILSVRSGGIRRGALKSLPITGAAVLDPAIFTWTARYTLAGSFGVVPVNSFVNSLRLTFRMDNYIRLYDLYLDFDFMLRGSAYGVQFDWGSYEFHYDFEDEMIRLSWGNVSSELLSPAGTNVGIRFDKAVSYGGPDAARKSHIEKYITIDRDSEVVILNEGREIFRRNLTPGNYRLEDFILYTGVNKIQIIVTPLDGSPAQETEIDLVYSSSLLAPGEIYYGGSLVMGRSLVQSRSDKLAGALRIPFANGYSLEYDARNFAIGGYIEAGLTESLTLDTSLAFRNSVSKTSLFQPTIMAAFELTHANILGTTRYNLNITEDSDDYGNFVLPEIYARIGHQVFTDWRALSAINFGITYDTDLANRPDRHSFMLSSSLSGSFGILGWGLSLSGTLRTDDIADPLYSASLTLSLSASRNVYFSAGLSVSGIGADAPSVFGRASATIRFNPTRTSVSVSNNRLSADFSVNSNRHSFSVSAETQPRTIASFDSYSFDADYSYSGSLFNVGAGLYADNSFNRVSGNFSVSTSSVFADGLVGFASYIPSNFILISQKGALKGNDISVGSVGSSMSAPLAKRFGIGLYTGISLDRASSLTVFSVNNESFGSATAFDITIPPTGRGGYALRLSAANKYSVSGVVVLPDGSIWSNGSSPMYKVVETEDSVTLERSDYYAFTDNDGRFIISDLPAGSYAFDVNFGDDWFLYGFSVYEDDDHAVDIQMLENPHLERTTDLPETYTAMYSYDNGEYLTGDQFWAILYPGFTEDAV